MALDPHGSTIYCSSFSKTIAPGYRVGWIATGRHMEKVLDNKFAFTLCGPALPQAALAEFLSSGGYDSHLRRVRRTFRDNIDRMIRTIDRAVPEGHEGEPPGGRLCAVVAATEAPCEPRTLRGGVEEGGLLRAGRCVFGKSPLRQLSASELRLGLACADRKGLETLGELAAVCSRASRETGSPSRPTLPRCSRMS